MDTNHPADESVRYFDSSEVHLQRELNDTVICGCAYVARGRADRRASTAKGAVGEGHVRIGPLRMVEQVEELATELEVDVLT